MKLKPIPYQSGFVFTKDNKSINEPDVEIIAQHNLNLEGIPHVDVGEDVQKLCDEYNYYLKSCRREQIPSKTFEEGFKCGHQANKKEFTREQMEKAMKEVVIHYNQYGEIADNDVIDIIIQSLRPKIESIEPETKEVEFGHVDDYSKPHGFNQQYITYQRDGKTYIKAKVNYE